MKLHWSPRSPFVRKVMVLAHETGLAGRLDCVRTVVAMETPNHDLIRDNPVIKLPTLVLDDGTSLYDSRVICEYLDTLHGGPKMYPSDSAARFLALRRQALGDGMLDILLLWRYERMQPNEKQREKLTNGFRVKLDATLAALEREAASLAASPFGIGHIAIGCALSYLDFRFPDEKWREGRPLITGWHNTFLARKSVQSTEVVDDF